MNRMSSDYPFGVEPDEQLCFKFLDDDPIFQRERFARLTAEPMLSRIRPRIEQMVHDRVELELVRALPLLAEQLFDEFWQEKLNRDLKWLLQHVYNLEFDIKDELRDIKEFFGMTGWSETPSELEDAADNWWRGTADEEVEEGGHGGCEEDDLGNPEDDYEPPGLEGWNPSGH